MGAHNPSQTRRLEVAIGRSERCVLLQNYPGTGDRTWLPSSAHVPLCAVATPDYHAPSPHVHTQRGEGETHDKDSAQHTSAARKRNPPHTTSCRTCALLFYRDLRVENTCGTYNDVCSRPPAAERIFRTHSSPPTSHWDNGDVSWGTPCPRHDSKRTKIDLKPVLRKEKEKK